MRSTNNHDGAGFGGTMTKDWDAQLERPAVQRRPAPAVPVVRRRAFVGGVDDPAEREADLVAERVVANLMSDPVRRWPAASRVRRSTAHAAAGVSDAGVPRPPAGGGVIGPGGGEVDGEVGARIDASRGRGHPLEQPLRRSMEAAFGGADFGGVRVHDGPSSAELNHRLGAQAFTLGQDVHLGRGAPESSSPAGMRLMAHELTHTLQGGGAARRMIRRLSVDKPLRKVKSIKVIQEGSSGTVAEVSDGSKPVIVKVDQPNAAEVIAADRLLREGQFGSDKFKVRAPRSRIATPADEQELTQKAPNPKVLKQGTERNFVTGLATGKPVLIAEKMGTETLKGRLEKATSARAVLDAEGNKTKQTRYKNDAAQFNKILRLVTNTRPIHAMAEAAAADVAMGMGDRVLSMFNTENFGYAAKAGRFNFVDNTHNIAAGYLTDKTTIGHGDAQANFKAWAAMPYLARLWQGDEVFAKALVSKYTGLNEAGDSQLGDGLYHFFSTVKRGSEGADQKAKFKQQYKDAVAANYPKLLAAAKFGIETGRKTVIGLLANPLRLTEGVDAVTRLDAMTSLLARRALLGDERDADKAWRMARREAQRMLGQPAAPAAPAGNSRGPKQIE
jgi:hypothetical protein